MMFVAAIALVSCSDDVLETPSTPVEAGAEVKFGLSLEGTRTVYGNEANNAFPIYWVNGDKVQILSPDCLEKRDNAEYKVSVSSKTQPYADNLTITRANGVQWGSKDKAIFYSIYPSGNYDYVVDKETKNVQISGLKIGNSQTIKVNATDKTIGEADMKNCLMYAVNDGGEANNHLGVPKSDNPVDLQYNPISTVIYVTLKVAANEDAVADNYTIQRVSLIAPEDKSISGSFSWDCESNSVVAGSFEGGSNVIMSEIVNDVNNFHTLTNDKSKGESSISFPIFIAPVSDLTVKNNWKIQVVANNTTYTKSLDINKALTPGQIHKITLPELKPSTTEWQVSNWMANIPRNVYLSEVSIPGSWNSLNKEFNTQATEGAATTIDNQYQKGIRAYHLDTRWKSSNNSYVLGTANGGNTREVVSDGRVMTDSNNPTFTTCLNAITANLKPEEYMVLVCTFAQGSYNYTADGKTWVDAISDACAGNEKVFDAKKLTENTVIGEVLNSLIVIVNLEGAVGNIPSDSKCLFVNMPLKLDNSTFTTNLTSAIYKGATNSTTAVTSGINMYHTQAQVCISDSYTVPNGQSTNNVDGRGYAPTFTARKNVANTILEDSRKNHADLTNYKHNEWIYLGLGGYYMTYSRGLIGIGAGWKAADNGHTNVAKDCNDWIDGKVKEMGTTVNNETIPYYPVGIVLMNKVEDYASTVKNILMLNTKYRMQRDPNRPTTSEDYALQQADYDGSLTNGGNAIQ